MNSSTIDFITNLLSDTLNLDFHYFIAPYPDIGLFDKHLRKSLTNSDLLYEKNSRVHFRNGKKYVLLCKR